jgi:hypothetical protein
MFSWGGTLGAEDLLLEGNGESGLSLQDAEVTMNGGTIRDNGTYGILAFGSTLTMTGSEVLGTGPENQSGYGVYASSSELVASDCVIGENRGMALRALDSRISLERSAVVDSRTIDELGYGYGLLLSDDSALEASDSVISGHNAVGLVVMNSTATLRDCEVLDTLPDLSAGVGYGIQLVEGAELSATTSTLQGHHGIALVLSAATATLDDCQVLDTREGPEIATFGIWSHDGSSLEATDCTVRGNAVCGMGVWDSDVSLYRGEVSDTFVRSDGSCGYGLNVGSGTTLEMVDTIMEGNSSAAIVAMFSPTVLTLDGVRVSRTHRSPENGLGVGIVVQEDAAIDASDVVVESNQGPGLYVAGAVVECASCTFSDNELAGVVVQSGGSLVLDQAVIEGNRTSVTGGGVGVFVSDFYQQNSLLLQSSTVRDNEMGAVLLQGPGSHQLLDNQLSGGDGMTANPGSWGHGDAIFVTHGADGSSSSPWSDEQQDGLLVRDNVITDSMGAGVFLDGASATLSGNAYEGNTIDLVRQACGEAQAPSGLDEEDLGSTELCPDYDYLVHELVMSPFLEEVQAEF